MALQVIQTGKSVTKLIDRLSLPISFIETNATTNDSPSCIGLIVVESLKHSSRFGLVGLFRGDSRAGASSVGRPDVHVAPFH